MDMIAMLAGFGGPMDNQWSDPTAAYGGSAGGGSTSGSGASMSWSNGTATGNAVSTAAGYGTVDEYLKSKGLEKDLPAATMPSKPVAESPYIAGQTKAEYINSLNLADGKFATTEDIIKTQEIDVTSWANAASGLARKERIRNLIRALVMVRSIDGDGLKKSVPQIQLAKNAIVALYSPTDFTENEFEKARSELNQDLQSEKIWANKREAETAGLFSKASYKVYDIATDDDLAIQMLRSFVAGFPSAKSLTYPNLGAFSWNRPIDKAFEQIKSFSDQDVIIGVSRRLAASTGNQTRPYNLPAISKAIAEGVALRLYGKAAGLVSSWIAAKDRYVPMYRRYVLQKSAYDARETYRANRIKAIEDYYTAVANKLKSDAEKKEYRDRRDALRRGAAAAEAEKTAARLKKEADDALAAKATAEQTARDLQTALNNLSNAGSTADVAALNATIEQLKQELANAQNAAAEAARNANQTATTGGGDTTGAAAVATDAAVDATQTASDALQQAGETVVVKPSEKKGGGVMLLVVGAVAVGGYMWWKRRQLRQIGP